MTDTRHVESADTVTGIWQGPDSEGWHSCKAACSHVDRGAFVVLDFGTANGGEYLPLGRLVLSGPGVLSLEEGLLRQDPATQVVSGDGILTACVIALRLPDASGGKEGRP